MALLRIYTAMLLRATKVAKKATAQQQQVHHSAYMIRDSHLTSCPVDINAGDDIKFTWNVVSLLYNPSDVQPTNTASSGQRVWLITGPENFRELTSQQIMQAL